MSKQNNLNPYLTFKNNTCWEALNFYVDVFPHSKIIDIKKYFDIPGLKEKMPEAKETSVYHATVELNGSSLMGADILHDFDKEAGQGTGVVTLAMNFDSEQELKQAFNKFEQNHAQVMMKPEKTDWNAVFGILKDKFGVIWQFHYQM